MTGRVLACQPVAASAGPAHVLGMAEKDRDREREERLGAALRENLRKRKAQARALSGPDAKERANGAE
jgi:hypothetical protein